MTLRRAAVLAALMLSAATVVAQKKVVKSQDDLPRFSYPVSGTATELLQSDDATFNVFAAKVKADVDSVLANYEIEDHATLRSLLETRNALQLLAGDEKGALETLAQVRDLEDKPDAKLLAGVRTRAMIQAHADTGKTSGPDFLQAYGKDYYTALSALPWAVVGNRVKEAKSSAQLASEQLYLGSVQAGIEPAVAKTHALSSDLAWGLINLRYAIKVVLPLKDVTVAVLTRDVAANNVPKPDIWESREVTLTAADKLTPVNVAIWDSGSDLALFPGRVYTDPHPKAPAEAHGLAFDLKAFPTTGYLLPLDAAQAKEYPGMRDELKGLSDMELSIDSPEATALKQKFASLKAAEVPAFIESLEFYSIYSHGTHVAGIASRGNPAIRLAAARITFDWHNVPLAPTDELVARSAVATKAYVAWFKAHGIRVVNMSWGGGPHDYEVALEKNGLGKDPAERKALAQKFFKVDHDTLYEAIKSAPEVLFICAAGNADSNSTFNEMIPSGLKLPNLLTVGAVDQAGDEASFTSYGDTVLVDADGYQVESVLPGGAKVRFSGTSMASPNTVNLAAKLLALDPKLTPEQVIHLIVAGATASEDGRRHNINPKASVALLKK
ncbi:Subtilase family protein [Granulicella rosea]|uniref:Subtilase family protein n=1 Tax=Granulicella rosea TaxID=474952 RepID=A0A239KUA3_9BACT|nr:S8 family serine peptidase [Granulicella rosea]SNT21947.1 Subtilase family protein [Granulicella rosea]